MFRADIRLTPPDTMVGHDPFLTRIARWLHRDKSGTHAPPDLRLDDVTKLMRELSRALDESWFDDVVSVLINDQSVYVDAAEKAHDLDEAVSAAVASGTLSAGFSRLAMVVSHRGTGQHVLAELTVHERFDRTHPGVTLALSIRRESLRPRTSDTPREFAERARRFAREQAAWAGAFAAVDGVVARVVAALERRFGVFRVRASAPVAYVTEPSPIRVARFRELQWRSQVVAPVYWPSRRPSADATWDPHDAFGFNPYHGLLCWCVLDEILAGRCVHPRVVVGDTQGRVLFGAADGVQHAGDTFAVARNAVQISEERITVDPSIPDVVVWDPWHVSGGA